MQIPHENDISMVNFVEHSNDPMNRCIGGTGRLQAQFNRARGLIFYQKNILHSKNFNVCKPFSTRCKIFKQLHNTILFGAYKHATDFQSDLHLISIAQHDS